MRILSILFFLSLLIITSCGDDDIEPEIPNEEELITTVNFTLTDSQGNSTTATFTDLDGDGGNAPVITGATLSANTNYTGSLTFLNESEDPAEDITEEIMEEDEEHQIFFLVDNSNITVAYADSDADGNPTGLSSTVVTGDAGSSTLTIVLRHEPNKSASGVAMGDITNAGGETDIEVSFDIVIQ